MSVAAPPRRGRWRNTDGSVGFFADDVLSNFAGPAIVVEAVQPWSRGQRISQRYRTVEHFFQASKAVRESDHLWVAAAQTPKEAKRRGRRIELRADWEETKYAVMLVGLRGKFTPGSAPGRALLATGTAALREESPYDRVWGTGPDGKGENLLGRALEELRAELRRKEGR
jgi:N-glycosidase YbiA